MTRITGVIIDEIWSKFAAKFVRKSGHAAKKSGQKW